MEPRGIELRLMGEPYAHPARLCVPLPDSLSLAGGAMLEPLGVAIHAVGLAKVKPARTVAVLGAGPIGLLVTQVALDGGAREVFVSESIAPRRAMAERLGLLGCATPERVIPCSGFAT